jgi:hypothetical protein
MLETHTCNCEKLSATITTACHSNAILILLPATYLNSHLRHRDQSGDTPISSFVQVDVYEKVPPSLPEFLVRLTSSPPKQRTAWSLKKGRIYSDISANEWPC